MLATTEAKESAAMSALTPTVRETYRKLRTECPLTPATSILRWARQSVTFSRNYEGFPSLDGKLDKTVSHTYRGIEFTARVEFDPDPDTSQGTFSNEKKSKWSVKNKTAWMEKRAFGFTSEYLWWNPADNLDGDILFWRKHGCSRGVAYERVLDMLKAMYKNACANRYYIVVKVHLAGTKMGEANLGGLDESQIDGEDSKMLLLDVLEEAIEDGKARLSDITKNAARFRRAARRLTCRGS